MTSLKTYFSWLAFSLLVLNVEAQMDSSKNQTYYEDLGLYSGISLVKLSGVAPSTTLNLGFIGGGRHLKYGFGYGISLTRGNSGTQYLSAYGLTNATSIEVPHDSETGYSYVSIDFQYYYKSTENPGSNFYAQLGLVTQIFSMVVTNGKYNPDEYYVQDDIFNISNTKINRGMGYAIQLGVGYQYALKSRLAFTSRLGFDFNFADNRKFSSLVLPNTHALMLGIGVKYTFLFSAPR